MTDLAHDGHGPLRCHSGCPAYESFMAEMHDQMKPSPTPDEAPESPSDLICGVCGRNVTNDPGTLCGGCGMSLTRAVRRTPVLDKEAVSLTNPEGVTSPEKVYPASKVMELLRVAYMEGAHVGARGYRPYTGTANHYFDRLVTRWQERGEL
jgi:hypothetical protein